mmetsp:Transcript_8633/g.12886  ORF Transcript_8633/g.12886 Transcript_8633/m.12886 type:complete len:223 (-) Transcript_8633:773-1441(-)
MVMTLSRPELRSKISTLLGILYYACLQGHEILQVRIRHCQETFQPSHWAAPNSIHLIYQRVTRKFVEKLFSFFSTPRRYLSIDLLPATLYTGAEILQTLARLFVLHHSRQLLHRRFLLLIMTMTVTVMLMLVIVLAVRPMHVSTLLLLHDLHLENVHMGHTLHKRRDLVIKGSSLSFTHHRFAAGQLRAYHELLKFHHHIGVVCKSFVHRTYLFHSKGWIYP